MSYPVTTTAAPQRLPVTGLVLHDPSGAETFELAASARSAADGKFRFVWTLAPGKTGPPEHHHLEAETFEVLTGVLRIWIEGEPRDYRRGDTVTIPPGVSHRFLNPGDVPVVVNVALGGTRMEDGLVPVALDSVDGKPGLRQMLRMMAGVGHYRSSVPTSWVQLVVVDLLARVLPWLGAPPYPPAIGWDRTGAADADRGAAVAASPA